MAYFARKLQYMACDGDGGASFVALIEITKKKGGRPVEFVLYRHVIRYGYYFPRWNRMVRFKAKTAGEAIRRFWPCNGNAGEEFPEFNSDLWEKTTSWLYSVAVGGGYQQFRMGTWIRVGIPAPRAKRRKKKPLQFGNISHILLVHQARLLDLESEILKLENDLELESIKGHRHCDDCDLGKDTEDTTEYDRVSEQIAEIEEEIISCESRIKATKGEMRFVIREMFPESVGKVRRRISRVS